MESDIGYYLQTTAVSLAGGHDGRLTNTVHYGGFFLLQSLKNQSLSGIASYTIAFHMIANVNVGLRCILKQFVT